MEPHRIWAGMDASGDQNSGNHKFMAIVIGTEENIAAMARRLGSSNIHMRGIKNPGEREAVLDKVRFDGRDCIGLCMRPEKNRVLEDVRNGMKGSRLRTNKMKAASAYHHLVWSMVHDRVEAFLREHSCEVRSIVFQCDADCRAFAKDMGWKITDAGPAHMLADIVAWANGHGREPEGAVSLDLVDGLTERMKSRFK